MFPRALIFIANGTEEMEFTITYDTLVRAGISCTSAFVPEKEGGRSQTSEGEGLTATCSRGVRIVADVGLESVQKDKYQDYDVIIVPGGAKGADTISTNTECLKIIRWQHEAGKLVAMICAGPLAALRADIVESALTSHPSVKDQLAERFNYKEDSVVVDRNLITSRGPGTTFLFAFAIVEKILGLEKRKEVEEPMVFPPN
ncbi:4-methyl-5(b-hydroxyethyl)-thiazole monophosphate biosynthesis [Ceratobasidium theobromae]|uniref:D-lactate dehydratase n=1 Tax=Ceratobasidium theobromae TaxID=1582974 RepID=A0A5N5QAQ1_9AGAM|nr:4-methyl-5(b-hydroxyethyl)-thiazole monophosphate biosynthesis [Ceratobasidium theobromae]